MRLKPSLEYHPFTSSSPLTPHHTFLRWKMYRKMGDEPRHDMEVPCNQNIFIYTWYYFIIYKFFMVPIPNPKIKIEIKSEHDTFYFYHFPVKNEENMLRKFSFIIIIIIFFFCTRKTCSYFSCAFFKIFHEKHSQFLCLFIIKIVWYVMCYSERVWMGFYWKMIRQKGFFFLHFLRFIVVIIIIISILGIMRRVRHKK